MKSRTQNNRTAAAIFAVVMGGSLPVGADPITIPNAGFEDRETYDPFPEGTDKYNQYRSETWRHFDLGNNGGPLRIWNPGVPGVNETPQGIADVAFGGNAPEGGPVPPASPELGAGEARRCALDLQFETQGGVLGDVRLGYKKVGYRRLAPETIVCRSLRLPVLFHSSS